MKTRVPALFTAGVLALSLAACGSEEAPEAVEETTGAAAEEEKGGSIFDLLRGMDDSTRELTNYTLDLSMTMPDPDFGDLDVDLTYEVMDDPQAVRITMVTPALGEMMAELLAMGGEDSGLTAEELGTQIMIQPADGETLVSDHTGMYESGSPWVRGGEDMTDLDPEELFDLRELPDLVSAFAEIEQVEEVGTEEVNGVSTTLVEVTLTEEEVDAMDAESKVAVMEFLGGTVEGTMEVSIWISEDGFPMRMNILDEAADMKIEFSEIGTTSFEIPSEDQISDM